MAIYLVTVLEEFEGDGVQTVVHTSALKKTIEELQKNLPLPDEITYLILPARSGDTTGTYRQQGPSNMVDYTHFRNEVDIEVSVTLGDMTFTKEGLNEYLRQLDKRLCEGESAILFVSRAIARRFLRNRMDYGCVMKLPQQKIKRRPTRSSVSSVETIIAPPTSMPPPLLETVAPASDSTKTHQSARSEIADKVAVQKNNQAMKSSTFEMVFIVTLLALAALSFAVWIKF